MHYDVTANDHGLRHDPFKAIVAPRPIGWITSMSASGAINTAPYSFFNAVSDRPHMVVFSSDGRKDSVTFVEETGEFTCSFPSFDLRERLNATSAPLPRGESEMAFAGLTPAPSRFVAPPRIAEAAAALECRWLQTVPLVPLEGGEAKYHLVVAQVVGIYIDDRFIVDGLVDTAAMKPIMRAGYHDYFTVTPEDRFSMTRPAGA